MPQSGECGPSHLSSVLVLAADHDPRRALPEVRTSEAQTGDGAILCFRGLRANYKNKTEGDKEMLIFMIYCIMPNTREIKKQFPRIFPSK